MRTIAEVVMRFYSMLLLLLLAAPVRAALTVVDGGDASGSGSPRAVIRPLHTAPGSGLAQQTPAPPAAGEEEAATPVWSIDPTRDRTYEGAFRRWAKAAGWDLVWNLPKPYEVANRSPRLEGEFTEVLSRALAGFGVSLCQTNPGLPCGVDAVFYRGNRVVTVSPLLSPLSAPAVAAPSRKRRSL